ncbi:MAG: hypothetical protein RL510_965 [Actinomycetota bacterium]|jgi:hypothetical protein
MVRLNWVSLLAAVTLAGTSLTALPAAADPVCTVTIAENATTWNGTNSSDVVCVTGNDNIINTLGGDDTVIDDGEGNTVNLGDGIDVYDGANGYDSIVYGGAGDDEIIGTPGDDEITAGEGDDTVVAGEGDDSISGGNGDDNLEGDAGADNILADAGEDSLQGGEGDDDLAGGPDIDQVNGGTGLNLCDFNLGELQTLTCRYDSEGPVLSSLIFTPNLVDVGPNSARVNFAISFTDQSGLRMSSISCQSPTGGLTFYINVWGGRDGRLYPSSGSNLSLDVGTGVPTGSPKSGTFSGHVVLPRGAATGNYSCTISLSDFLGNTTFQTQVQIFTVVNSTGQGDVMAPIISQFSLSPAIVDTTSTSPRINYTFRVQDASGMKSGTFTCSNDSTAISFYVSLTGGSDARVYNSATSTLRTDYSVSAITGDTKDFTITGYGSIPHGAKPETYSCRGTMTDTLGNSINYRFANAFSSIRDEGTWDDQGPDIESAVFDPSHPDVGTSTADISFQIKGKDASGFASGQFQCFNQSQPVFFMLQLIGGQNSQVYVNTSSNPSMDFQWIEILGNNKDFTVNLVLRLPAGIAPGKYVCRTFFTDYVGNQTQTEDTEGLTVFRTPAGQPSTPQFLQFISDGEGTRTGRLSWSAPLSLGSPSMTEYILEYSQDQGATWTKFNTIDKSVTSIPLTGLKANTDYQFRVRGENGGTAGQDENYMALSWAEISAKTPQALVPTPPRNLSVREIGSTSAKIAFDAPVDDRASLISDLKVEISRDGLTWTQVSSVPSLALGHSVSGLAPGTKYFVRVSATNAIGMSDAITTTFTTAKSKASRVLNLLASKVSFTTLSLGWAIPASNGGNPITNYVVQYSKDASTWAEVTHKASTSRGINVSGLKPGIDYVFRVAAVTSLGIGAWSEYVYETTLGNAPFAPTSLSVTPSATSVIISWKAALVTNGPSVTNYLIEYTKDNKTWITVKKAVSNSTKLTVIGLKSKTVYRFRVSAVNSIGTSKASGVLKFSTK